MKQLTDTLSTLAIGAAGTTATHVVNTIDPNTIQTVFNIVIQIAIGLVTLWGLFAKKKTTGGN